MPEKPFSMPTPWELIPARFIKRPNRFITHLNLDGKEIVAHLPDPGRLEELLLPDVEMLIQYNPGPTRKTDYTVHLVKSGGRWVCINTLLPNIFVEQLLRGGHLPFIDGWEYDRKEVTHGASRFDFRLTNGADQLWLEVKSVTFVENGIAQFPDAVSARAAKHALHLAELALAGDSAMILFVIQRDDARLFQPMWQRDPVVGRALNEAAAAGVAIHAIRTVVTPDSFTFGGEVEVDLAPPGQ